MIQTKTNIQDEVANCGKPISIWDAKTGKMKTVNRRCKRYSQCPKCAAYKKSLIEKELIPFVGDARFIIVSKEDEKKMARRYDNYRRVAISDTHTAFVIESNDTTLGCEFTRANLELVTENSLPQNGRQISGKLGIKKTVIEPGSFTADDWDEIEKEINDPILEVSYREFRIDYETDDKNAPKNIKELEAVVQAEIDFPHSPSTEGELQEGMYVLEMTTKKVCEKYDMSFSFLGKKVNYIRISEVEWEWLENKII